MIKNSDLHRLAEEPGEWLPAWVCKQQYRLPTVAQKLQRPN